MRLDYPVFDEPPPAPRDNFTLPMLVFAHALTWFIVAVNLLGPTVCTGRALTPECVVALTEVAGGR